MIRKLYRRLLSRLRCGSLHDWHVMNPSLFIHGQWCPVQYRECWRCGKTNGHPFGEVWGD